MRDDKNLGIAIGDKIGRWTTVAVIRDAKHVKFVCSNGAARGPILVIQIRGIRPLKPLYITKRGRK